MWNVPFRGLQKRWKALEQEKRRAAIVFVDEGGQVVHRIMLIKRGTVARR